MSFVVHSALIITGTGHSAAGFTAEVFVPSTGEQCELPRIPMQVWKHTMDKLTMCGGERTYKHCYTLQDGAWVKTLTLQGSWYADLS